MNLMNKPRVLVVDDEPIEIKILVDILGPYYETTIAKDGNQALKRAISDRPPELILLDIIMPGIDGYETCIKLKKIDILKDIPVIFLTAKTDTEDIVKGFDVGAVDYITKPFKPPELLARVKTHIELKRACEEIKTLRGIIPICANCKKVRNDDGFWEQVETYVGSHTEAVFSHGLCPDCRKKLFGNLENNLPEYSKK